MIRPIAATDIPALKGVIDSTGLFPSDLLDDMISAYLKGDAPDESWLTVDHDGAIAIAYVAPERMTQGTWNLLLIAVHSKHQARGHGAALVRHIEQVLSARGQRILLVETSGLPDFERTRHFYDKLGYVREARIRDYYQAGDDKIVFSKALGRAAT